MPEQVQLNAKQIRRLEFSIHEMARRGNPVAIGFAGLLKENAESLDDKRRIIATAHAATHEFMVVARMALSSERSLGQIRRALRLPTDESGAAPPI